MKKQKTHKHIAHFASFTTLSVPVTDTERLMCWKK